MNIRSVLATIGLLVYPLLGFSALEPFIRNPFTTNTPAGVTNVVVGIVGSGTNLSSTPFSIVHFPDTQYQTNCLGVFSNSVTHIISTKTASNTVMVVCAGDVADNAAIDTEYITLTNQLWRLRAAGIPCMFVPGNHDYSFAQWEKFMSPFLMTDPNLADMFVWGQTYYGYVYTQDVSGLKLAYIGINFSPTAAQMTWMKDEAKKYSDRLCILVYHEYFGNDGSVPMLHTDPNAFGSSVTEWTYTNVVAIPNLIQVISGHQPQSCGIFGSTFHHTSLGTFGNLFYEYCFDFQWAPPYIGGVQMGGQLCEECGVSWLRYYQFFPLQNMVQSWTYDNYGGTNRTTEDCQFQLPLKGTSLVDSNAVYEISSGVAAGAVSGPTGATGLAAPVDYGLLLYCPLNENTNGLIHDMSGYAQTSIMTGAATNWLAASNSVIGTSLQLWSNNIAWGTAPFDTIVSNLTVAFWANTPTNALGNGQMIFCRHNLNTDGAFFIDVAPSSGFRATAAVINNSSTRADVTATSLRSFDSVWHHYALTWDGQNVRLWIDGVNEATTNLSGTLKTGNWIPNIGGLGTQAAWEAYAGLDDLRVWGRTLGAVEIQQLALNTNRSFSGIVSADTISGLKVAGNVSGVTNNNNFSGENQFSGVATFTAAPVFANGASVVGNLVGGAFVGNGGGLTNLVTTRIVAGSNIAITTNNPGAVTETVQITSTAEGAAIPFTNADFAFGDIYQTDKVSIATGVFTSTAASNWLSGKLTVGGVVAGNGSGLTNLSGMVNLKDYGAVGNGSTDDSLAVSNAWYACQYGSKAPCNLYVPVGQYPFTNTLVALVDGVGIIGESGKEALGGSTLYFTGTNAPIIRTANSQKSFTLKNLLLIYSAMQPDTATGSMCVQLGTNSSMPNFDNVFMRRGAYGLYGYSTVYNGGIGSLKISSFSRSAFLLGGGTPWKVDRLWIQNNADAQVLDLVNVTNAATDGATALTFYCDQLPVYMVTNRMIEISGLDSAVNKFFFVDGFDPATFAVYVTSASVIASITDKTGTLYAPGQPCAEAPVQLLTGEIDFGTLDIEWTTLTNTVDNYFSVLTAESAESVKIGTLHVEGCFSGGQTEGLRLVETRGAPITIDQMVAVNMAVQGNSHNTVFYVRGTSAGLMRTIQCNNLLTRDLSSTGQWWEVERAANNDSSVVVLNHFVATSARANATGALVQSGAVSMSLTNNALILGTNGTQAVGLIAAGSVTAANVTASGAINSATLTNTGFADLSGIYSHGVSKFSGSGIVNGNVAIISSSSAGVLNTSSGTTAAELEYLHDVTGPIMPLMDARVLTNDSRNLYLTGTSNHMTGNLTVAGIIDSPTINISGTQSVGTLVVTNTPVFNDTGLTNAQGQTIAQQLATNNLVKRVIGVSIPGTPSTGVAGTPIIVPYAGTISGWSIAAMGASPTCTFDVWKVGTGTTLPTVANTIMGTKPALSTGNAVRSTTMTGWTSATNITAGDIFIFNLDAVSASATNVTFSIEIQP